MVVVGGFLVSARACGRVCVGTEGAGRTPLETFAVAVGVRRGRGRGCDGGMEIRTVRPSTRLPAGFRTARAKNETSARPRMRVCVCAVCV